MAFILFVCALATANSSSPNSATLDNNSQAKEIANVCHNFWRYVDRMSFNNTFSPEEIALGVEEVCFLAQKLNYSEKDALKTLLNKVEHYLAKNEKKLDEKWIFINPGHTERRARLLTIKKCLEQALVTERRNIIFIQRPSLWELV